MRLVLDVENSTKTREREGKQDKLDLLPFSGDNQLVSVGLKNIDTGEVLYHFFYHNELPFDPEALSAKRAEIQTWLDQATLIIGHFVKHDIIWMRAAGFRIKQKQFWDTAIAEYVMHRGQTKPLSLADLANKWDLVRKKTELTGDYLDKGVGFEAMPLATVDEYGRGDLDTTEALFHHQNKRLQDEENIVLVPTITMMNDFMFVLSKWQANGIKIDKVALEKVRAEYVIEQKALVTALNDIARKVMGDTPFNLNSNDDKSVLIYSRRVIDKKKWKERFNIGTSEVTGKALRRPRLTPQEFASSVRDLTKMEYRTKATQCEACQGTGRFTPPLKSGLPGKAKRICKSCEGKGIIYTPTSRIAGFKFQAKGVKDTTAHGFDTDKGLLERLALTATGTAKEFLEKLKRLNAVNVYISTFCDGILTNMTKDCVLYTNFNQCIVATGRLSSTDPNFQNQPRGKTFPVRRAIISRFPGGKITEADAAQLEFRVAGELSMDKQIFADIKNKVDIHAFTRDTLNAAGMNVDRQDAKPHTFKPVYGGEYGTPAEMAYYAAFRAKYQGLARWQKYASETVLRTGVFTLPTGRQYRWSDVKRRWDGKVDFFTQIVNYPVQGFATGDIIPLACIIVDREFTRLGLKSIPFLTVHDSIAVDTVPEETSVVPNILADSILATKKELLTRYDYRLRMPLEVEVKIGVNWLDTSVILKQAHEYGKDSTPMPSMPANSKDFFDDPIPF